jgi:hypothetical protein
LNSIGVISASSVMDPNVENLDGSIGNELLGFDIFENDDYRDVVSLFEGVMEEDSIPSRP